MSQRNGGGMGGFSIIEEKTVPDVYADSTSFEVSIYGVTLQFGQTRPTAPGHVGASPHIPRVRVMMSPQHAKVVAKLFVKNMKAYEDQVGKIALPAELLRELGIEDKWD